MQNSIRLHAYDAQQSNGRRVLCGFMFGATFRRGDCIPENCNPLNYPP